MPHSRRTRAKFFEREIDVEAGDGFELVERAAGVSEAAAADHGNGQAARSDDRSEDERSFVADAAGGVLVDFLAGKL